MRVHTLAKQLNVTSKVVLEKCKAEGLSVENHMSTLSAGLEATIREWFSEGEHGSALETAERVDLDKVRLKRRRKAAAADAPSEEAPIVETEVEHDAHALRKRAAGLADGAGIAVAEAPPQESVPESPVEAPFDTGIDVRADEFEEPPPAEIPVEALPPATAIPEPVTAEIRPADDAEAVEAAPTPEAPQAEEPAPVPAAEPVRPAGPQNVPAPAKLSGPRVVRYEPIDPQLQRPPFRAGGPRRRSPSDPIPQPMPLPPSGAGAAWRRRGTGRAVADANATRVRPRREGQRGGDAGEKLREWRDRDMAELRERLQGATGRRIHSRRIEAKGKGGGASAAPQGPITTAEVSEPIVIKDYCAALSLPFVRLVSILKREHNLMPNINGTLPRAVAELVAAGMGVELIVGEDVAGPPDRGICRAAAGASGLPSSRHHRARSR
jgi:hypothetical protein